MPLSSFLTLQCAESHPHYLPRPVDPRWAEADRLSEEIRKTKQQDPYGTGATIYDGLVDSLVTHMRTLAKEREFAPEPASWTPPERCVWRSANKLSHDERWRVIEDKSICKDVKAFAVVNQGRWLCPCPFPGCSGAQYASYTSRKFFCVDCLNKPVGGKWVEVIWPDSPLSTEGWLAERPEKAKNWNPGETGEDIAEQDAGRDVVKGRLSTKVVDVSGWSKTGIFDGETVPVRHCGTDEWDESQKDDN